MNTESIPVLLVVRELNLGGIERDVSKFARHLGAHGIEPHVAAFKVGGMRSREIEAAGIPLLNLPIASLKSLGALKAAASLHRYIRRHRIRVVHAFEPATAVFAIPVARLTWGTSTLFGQLCYRGLNPPELRKTEPWLDRMSSGLFVNSRAVARHLAADYGIAPDRIHLCHNGFEPAEFHPRGRSRPPALRHAGVVIGAVAVLRSEKNLDLLIEAFARVRAAHPDAALVIVGSGPEREALHRQVAGLGLSEAVVFEEATAKPAGWMRAIDVFVLPSRSESFSNALLEAMACGCCPVGSDVGGTGELIQHGVRGLLFENGSLTELTDSLLELAANEKRRTDMAAEAARFAHDNLTIDVATARLASIYRDLTAGRPAAGT